MNNTSKQVLIVAGEASGDHHASRLVEELHKRDPSVHFAGIGGERMRKAGVEILVDSAEMAVVWSRSWPTIASSREYWIKCAGNFTNAVPTC